MNVAANIGLRSGRVSAIPSTALIQSGGHDYVFMMEEESIPGKDHHGGHDHAKPNEEPAAAYRFVGVPVSKGVTNDAFTEITPLQEIPENPKVVIHGAFYLMSMLTNLDEEGHEH